MYEGPKLQSIPRAARVIGEDKETVRAWALRTVDPLPTVVSGGNGNGIRIRRKVVMAEVDEWLRRQANKERGAE
jgi:hypothetical protein